MNTRARLWLAFLILPLLVAAAAIGIGQAQEKGGNSGPAWKYRVAKIQPNIVDIDYNVDGKTRKTALHPSHALDELGKEGWELVSVILQDSGEYICFLKAPK